MRTRNAALEEGALVDDIESLGCMLRQTDRKPGLRIPVIVISHSGRR